MTQSPSRSALQPVDDLVVVVRFPYTFHYVFECDDSDKPHTAMCEDWELGMLFLNEAERLGADEAAAASALRWKPSNRHCSRTLSCS